MILRIFDAFFLQNSIFWILFGILTIISDVLEEIIGKIIESRYIGIIENLSLSKKMTYRPPLLTRVTSVKSENGHSLTHWLTYNTSRASCDAKNTNMSTFFLLQRMWLFICFFWHPSLDPSKKWRSWFHFPFPEGTNWTVVGPWHI